MDSKCEKQIAGACVAGRVRILNRVVSGILDAELRPFGVRSSQINILTSIAAHGPVTASDVCRRLCLEKSTLSRDLERLVARGWIVSKPGSGRSLQLEASDSGRALLKDLQPAWERAQTETEKLLGAPFIEALFRLVDGGALAEYAKR